MKRFLILLALAIPLLFAGWSWVSLKFVFSHGERAGYLQKISKRGWVFKTWEGQIAMANLPGSMPEVFDFTVRDDAVAQQLVSVAGQRVSISYEQHRGLPGRIFGDTQYFVTKVASIADPYAPNGQQKSAVPPPAK